MSFNGKHLEDDKKLQDYNTQEEPVPELVVKYPVYCQIFYISR